ncbi:MAG: hypothetical protein ACKOBO_01365 [Acidimicrobiales bacterium]
MTTHELNEMFAKRAVELKILRMSLGDWTPDGNLPDYLPLYEQILAVEKALWAAKRLLNRPETF